MKSCFLFGHRDTPVEILQTLTDVMEKYITKRNVREFFVGNYGGFDRIAAKALIAVKSKYPKITLSLLIPYHPAERRIILPKGFDNTFYPPGIERVPRRFAIVQANRYMIDHMDCFIAYVWHPASNARELLEYVKKKKKYIVNLAEI